jgi:hypothetical protein
MIEKQERAIENFLKSGGDILRLQHDLGHKHVRSTLTFAMRQGLFQKLHGESVDAI